MKSHRPTCEHSLTEETVYPKMRCRATFGVDRIASLLACVTKTRQNSFWSFNEQNLTSAFFTILNLTTTNHPLILVTWRHISGVDTIILSCNLVSFSSLFFSFFPSPLFLLPVFRSIPEYLSTLQIYRFTNRFAYLSFQLLIYFEPI